MKVVVEGRLRCCSKCCDVAIRGYDGLIDKRHECQGTRVRSWTPVRACCQGNRAGLEPPRESSRTRAAKGIESAR